MIGAVRLQLDSITPNAGARALVAGRVEMLAQSLRVIGLRTPITVRNGLSIVRGRPTPGYEIVAGRHRLAAAKSLGWTEIDAFIMGGSAEDAELWEIDENFARADLTDAQRADHHKRRAKILAERGEVAVNGGDRRSDKQFANLKSYADQAAETLGVHPNTVRRDMRRADRIEPDVLAGVTGTDLDKGVVLDELVATPRDQQAAKLEEIRDRRSMVRPAPDPLNDPEAHEKQLSALMSAWNRAAGVVREEFLLRIEQPVFDATSAGRG